MRLRFDFRLLILSEDKDACSHLLLCVTFADGADLFGEGTLNNAHALAFGKMDLRLFRLLVSRRIKCHRLLLLSDLDATSSLD